MASSNPVVWSGTFAARYSLALPEKGKLIKRYVWVDHVGAEYLLNDVTVFYEPSPFEIPIPPSLNPRYVSEQPLRFGDACVANDAAHHVYAKLISEGWQHYVGEIPKHQQR